MLQKPKNVLIVGAAILALCYGSYLVGQWNNNNQGSTLPPAPVATLDYECKGPLKVYDKGELRKATVIPKAVASDDSKQVTATGTKKDETGTTHVSAVLDTSTGQSTIIQQRPRAEFLKVNAIGIGAELNPRGMERELYYRRTFARIFDGYPSVTLGGREWEDKKELFIKVNAEWHF